MDYSWAKPGVKVVCVASPWTWGRMDWRLPFLTRLRALFSRHPRINETLVIAETEADDDVNDLFLSFQGFGDRQYRIRNFRPLISRTQDQDVALFRHLLDGLPVGERA